MPQMENEPGEFEGTIGDSDVDLSLPPSCKQLDSTYYDIQQWALFTLPMLFASTHAYSPLLLPHCLRGSLTIHAVLVFLYKLYHYDSPLETFKFAPWLSRNTSN